MNKSEIRKYIRDKKANLTMLDICNYSEQITKKLLTSDIYLNASSVYIYINMNQEVITRDIISDAWNNGKKVAVPKIIDNIMKFYYIDSFSELAKGFYNVMEPTTNNIADDIFKNVTNNVITNEELTLMILPGLAFDSTMNRIGYGGGYYDRYLGSNNNFNYFYKVALAYDFQIIDTFGIDNYDEHDVKVDCIITNNHILLNNGGKHGEINNSRGKSKESILFS